MAWNTGLEAIEIADILSQKITERALVLTNPHTITDAAPHPSYINKSLILCFTRGLSNMWFLFWHRSKVLDPIYGRKLRVWRAGVCRGADPLEFVEELIL